MKMNDWYAGAMFIAGLWAFLVPTLYVTAAVLGIPMAVVHEVTSILGIFMTMLALILVGMGSATVVAADIRKRVS